MKHSKYNRSLLPLVVAIAAISCGSALAADEVSPVLKAAMQRDMGVNAQQMSQYLKTERVSQSQAAVAQRQLGAGYAGSWIERKADGSFVFVAATAGAKALAIPGVELRRVRYSLSRLQSSMSQLDGSAQRRVMGISKLYSGVHSWHVDPTSNSVVVTFSPGASEEAIDLVAASGADVATVRFVESVDKPSLLATIRGGILYGFSPGATLGCSVGIPARRGGIAGYATAGHCGSVGTRVYVGNSTLGSFTHSNFPGTDRAYVQVSTAHTVLPEITDHNGGVVPVRGSVEAAIGAAVCRSGYRTGYRCGSVTGKNVTVNYQEGTVRGLTQSSACAGKGDSGGAWITPAGQAQGVTSGGNVGADGTNCSLPSSQVRMYFDRLNPILSQYGLTLMTR